MSICGVTPPRHGQILFRGDPIQNLSAEQIVSQGIIQVPEGRHIFPQMSVIENLEMGAYLRNDRAGIKTDIDDVFGRFPILGKRRHQAGGTLSGGEQQMLAISRALLARPSLLLLDEPAAGMNPQETRELDELIVRIRNEDKLAILLIEHDMKLVMNISDRIYVMEYGKEIAQGTPQQIKENPKVIEAYLGEEAHA